MREEEFIAKINEILNNSDIMSGLDDYFRSSDGNFDLDQSYHNSDYWDLVRNSYNEEIYENIAKAALYVAKGEISKLREYEMYKDLSDDELLIAAACEAAEAISRDENKHLAYKQAEEWSYDSNKVDHYGSKRKAFDRGYDDYINSHFPSYYSYYDEIMGQYFDEKNMGNEQEEDNSFKI